MKTEMESGSLLAKIDIFLTFRPLVVANDVEVGLLPVVVVRVVEVLDVVVAELVVEVLVVVVKVVEPEPIRHSEPDFSFPNVNPALLF